MIGKLLREARTSRNFTPGDVADAWNRMRNTDRFTAGHVVDIETSTDYNIDRLDARAIVAAIRFISPMGIEERDRLLAATGIVPKDILDMLCASPDRYEEIRAILTRPR